jgi:hypothetical protein
VMSSGQVVGVIDDLPSVAELVQRIIAEAEATLTRLNPPGSLNDRGGQGPLDRSENDTGG